MKNPVSNSKCYRINGLSYIPIEGFPQYAINHTGKIIHILHGEVIPHENASGHLVVNLHRDGCVHPRLIHILVLNHFDPLWDREELHPHLDGDKQNNHIRNLTRRLVPLDLSRGESPETRVGFKNGITGDVYRTILEAAKKTGISASQISKYASMYRSFILDGVRFTVLFA